MLHYTCCTITQITVVIALSVSRIGAYREFLDTTSGYHTFKLCLLENYIFGDLDVLSIFFMTKPDGVLTDQPHTMKQ